MSTGKLDFSVLMMIVSFGILFLIAAVFYLTLLYKARKNIALANREKLEMQFTQTLLNSKIELHEQAAIKTTRDLHDNVGQVLSLARITLNKKKTEPEEADIEVVDELLGKAIVDLRNITHSLHLEVTNNRGWQERLQSTLDAIQKSGICNTQFDTYYELPNLSHDKSIILFRMLQQILAHIVRQTGSKRIEVKAANKDGTLVIQLTHDGHAFDPSFSFDGVSHVGLEEKAKIINASIESIKNASLGQTVIVTVKPV